MKKNKNNKKTAKWLLLTGIIRITLICTGFGIYEENNNDALHSLPDTIKTFSVSQYNAKAKPKSEEPKVVWYDYMIDADDITGATEEEFNELIEYICDYRDIKYSKCPFYNKGDILVQIEEDYQISGIACLAIWTWESGFGTSTIATNRNNYGGISGKRGYRYFDTIEDGMLYQGKLLRNTYVDCGCDTWASIGKKYCPGNSKWATNICGTLETYAEELYSIIH